MRWSNETKKENIMTNREPGYVNILANPNFREEWVKIGKSARLVDVRIKELFSLIYGDTALLTSVQHM